MKRLIFVLLVILLFVLIIPKEEMIRIRVLANSNSDYDQEIKGEVVEVVKREFKDILKDVNNISEARNQINDNLEKINKKVDTFLSEKSIDYKSKINFGLNYFPTKKYNEKTFKEGYYESVLITLGNGDGDNWWCILFPTVCLNEENVKYESFFKTVLQKILK